MRASTILGCAFVATLAACGLVSGLDGLKVGDLDASLDATTISDSSLDVGISCEAGACGAPDGFQPVYLALDRNGSCGGSQDVIVDPAPQSDACTCTCTPTSACVPQALSYKEGESCTTASSSPVVLDGGCNLGSGSVVPSRMSVGPFSLDAGACTGSVSVDGVVASTAGRVCGLSSCTACAAPSGFALCFLAPSSTCPSSMTAHTVAMAAEVSCTPCSACTATGSCGGTLAIYDDSQCLDQTDSVPVTGDCHSVSADVFGSFRYTPSLLDASCSPGTSQSGLVLTQSATICCP